MTASITEGSKIIETLPVTIEKVQLLARTALAEPPSRWDKDKSIAIVDGDWAAMMEWPRNTKPVSPVKPRSDAAQTADRTEEVHHEHSLL